MGDNTKSTLIAIAISIAIFLTFFFIAKASQKAAEDSKIPVVEKYHQNLSVSPAHKMVIASHPFKITDGMWAYLCPTKSVGTDLNNVKFFTTLYAPTNQLAIGDTVKAVKFHGNDSYGYFYVSKK